MIEWFGRVAGPALGLALTALLFAGVALAVRRRWPKATLLDQSLATALVGFVGIVLGLELLSAFRSISIGGITLVASALGVGGSLIGFSARGERLAAPGPSVVARDGVTLPALMAAALAAWALLVYLLRGLILPVQTVSDAPIYHLYFAASWREAGSLALVPTPFGELAATYFPANGDLWLTWLLVGAGDDSLARAGQWPFALVAALALFGLGLWSGGDRSGALFPPALWSTSFLVLYSSALANVDLCLAAWYLVAVYFLARAWEERDNSAEGRPYFIFFALAAGSVAGTKSIGLLFLLPLLIPALAIWARSPGRIWVGGLALAAFLAPAAFWYGRNMWLTGNPLYPLAVSLLDVPVLPGWYDRSAMLASGYHLPVTDWAAMMDRLSLVLDGRLVALWLLALVGSVFLAMTRRPRSLPLSLVGVALWLLFWFVNPYNSQERFLIAAFGCGLVPLAPILSRRAWLQWPCVALMAWHLLTPPLTTGFLGNTNTGPVLIPLTRDPLSQGSLGLALALPIGVGLALLAARHRHWIVALVLLLAGAIASAWPSIQFFHARPLARYLPATDFGKNLLDAWTAVDEASRPDGARVAYTGTNLPYYLLGADLRNRVRYVHVSDPGSGLAHEIDEVRRRAGDTSLSADPWPEWYRGTPEYATWLENLRRAGIELVFIARENRHGRLDNPEGPPPFPIEAQWAREHPEHFELLSPLGAADGRPEDSASWALVYRFHP